MRFITYAALAAVAAVAAAADQDSCYFPNGHEATQPSSGNGTVLTPCLSKGDEFFPKQCCDVGHGDVCLQNGLCQKKDQGSKYRGGCQTSGWGGCEGICMDVANGATVEVRQCGTTNAWCCNEDPSRDCCADTPAGALLQLPDHFDPYTWKATALPASASSSATKHMPTSTDDVYRNNTAGGKTHHHKTYVVFAVVISVVGALVVGLAIAVFAFWLRKDKKRVAARAEAKAAEEARERDGEPQMEQEGSEDEAGKPPAGGYYEPRSETVTETAKKDEVVPATERLA